MVVWCCGWSGYERDVEVLCCSVSDRDVELLCCNISARDVECWNRLSAKTLHVNVIRLLFNKYKIGQ